MNARAERITVARARGDSLAAIAQAEGISKQRVHQILRDADATETGRHDAAVALEAVVRLMRDQGATYDQIAKASGVSRATVGRVLHRLREATGRDRLLGGEKP